MLSHVFIIFQVSKFYLFIFLVSNQFEKHFSNSAIIEFFLL